MYSDDKINLQQGFNVNLLSMLISVTVFNKSALNRVDAEEGQKDICRELLSSG